MFFKMVVLKNFAIFTGKQLCWSLFLIKLLVSLFLITLLKARMLSCEYCEMLEMLNNSFFTEHNWWSLLRLLSEELQDRMQKFSKYMYYIYIYTQTHNNLIWLFICKCHKISSHWRRGIWNLVMFRFFQIFYGLTMIYITRSIKKDKKDIELTQKKYKNAIK